MTMRRPAHTTLVAYVALFVAVGTGGAYAASLQPASVKSRHIADGTIRSNDVRRGAIGSKQLAEVPNGLMTRSKEVFYVRDGYITYDRVNFGDPRGAFDPRTGIFTAPVDGTYLVVARISWRGVGARSATVQRNFRANVLTSTFSGEGDQIVAGPVRLSADDRLVVYVDAGGVAAGDSPGASLTVSFLSN
jgi:hypothetical protein